MAGPDDDDDDFVYDMPVDCGDNCEGGLDADVEGAPEFDLELPPVPAPPPPPPKPGRSLYPSPA